MAARISVCLGSACHLRGSRAVLAAFSALVARHKLEVILTLEGHFCTDRCTKGVVVTIDDEVITGVTREQVYDIFMEKVLGGG